MPRTIHRHQRHLAWDRTIPPIAEIPPGTTLTVETHEASDGQLSPDSVAGDLLATDPGRVNPVTGPIAIEGAEPGDTLAVTIREVEGSGWGWTAIIPEFGLLADDFGDPYLLHTHYAPADDSLDFAGVGVTVPYRPFIGTIGVAPAAPGPHDVIPPRHVGGNLDLRDVRPGATLYLPVEVDRALLSLGDTHAAQGDGEVCGTAIETPATVTLTVDLQRDHAVTMPALDLPAQPQEHHGPWHVTTGVGPDLMEASRAAVRAMIDWLGTAHELDPRFAYCLCSVAAHLRIREIVDAPNWVVSCDLPLDVLA